MGKNVHLFMDPKRSLRPEDGLHREGLERALRDSGLPLGLPHEAGRTDADLRADKVLPVKAYKAFAM